VRGNHNTWCMTQYGLRVAWRVCDLWVSMCSRRGTFMAGWGVHDAWGIENGFGAARGSAGHAWQVVSKVFDEWEWRYSWLSRDMDEEGYLVGLQGSCLVSLRWLWRSAGTISRSDVHRGSVVKCWEHDRYNAKSWGDIETWTRRGGWTGTSRNKNH